MSLFSSLQIPPPAHWQDFEVLCCDLWRAIWDDPNTQRNGRQGQPQHGVDVYGRPHQENSWSGVQCKGKDHYSSRFLTEKEVKTEVEKAKSFKPTLSHYIIATTGPKDARIEELARAITEEHSRTGLFSVHVWGWPDIVARLADFPDLLEKHYPGLSVNVKELKKEISTLKRMAAREVRPQVAPDFPGGALYVVCVEILGLEQLTRKIAETKGITWKTVRENLIAVVRTCVTQLESKGSGVDCHREKWFIAAHDLDCVFTSISEILDHHTGFVGYEKIPLGIGVGTAERDRELSELISFCRREDSFIVITDPVYHQIEPSDRKMVTHVGYKDRTDVYFLDVTQVHERGKVFAFLEEVGYPMSKIYGRIDELFVPPAEYNDIKKMLHKERIVFITGTCEYGKTYTAVRLMWEYYRMGYHPHWIKGGEEKERITVRKKLEDIEAVLKPHHIIYFEDPFGRRRYERKEGLERGIGTIIDSVKRLEDTYVIITSREEVFKEFEKEKVSRCDIKRVEKRLGLKRPSYDYRKRKEILVKWAEHERCTWVEEPGLLTLVADTIRNEKALPTPLSMRDFSKATVYANTLQNLKEKIKEKSEETAMAFSREIKQMTDDKVIFLSFLFVMNQCKVDFVRNLYESLVVDLRVADAWAFDRVLQWFMNDKVNTGAFVEFSHPSYAEALKYLLVEDGYVTRINREIFSNLLFSLAEHDEAAQDVAWTVAYNFDKLLHPVQELLFNLCENINVARYVAWNTAHHFEHLSGPVQNLLYTLCEKAEVAKDVAWTVAYNFEHLSGPVQNLLYTLCEKAEGGGVAHAVVQNFDRLSPPVRNDLLVALAEGDAAPIAAQAVTQYFDSLPRAVRNGLLVKFSENFKTAEAAAHTVAEHFDKLSGSTRNNLLVTLAEKEGAASTVVKIVAHNFDKLSGSTRNNLLVTLAEKEGAGIVQAVAVHFDKLSPPVQDTLLKTFSGSTQITLLHTLASKDKTSRTVAEFVVRNFHDLPQDTRHTLLVTLAEKEGAARYIAAFVAKIFNQLPGGIQHGILLKLPHDTRNDILFTLAEKDETSRPVAGFVVRTFKTLPHTVQHDLLAMLAEKEGAARYIAQFIHKNFGKFPDTDRNDLLVILSKQGKAATPVARVVTQNFKRFPRDVRDTLLLNLPPHIRNDVLLKCAEKDETAAAVAGFVVRTFKTLSHTVRNDLLVILSGKERSSGVIAGIIAETFNEFPRDLQHTLVLNLSESEAAPSIAGLVVRNFGKFPRNVQNTLLLNLSEPETARDAARIVANNFDKISSTIRNKRLVALAERDEAAHIVVTIVKQNFDNFPTRTRNKLLLKLAKKDEIAGEVVRIVADNFDKISGTTRKNLLARLAEKDEAVNVATLFIIKEYDSLPEDLRLFLFKLSEKG
jgi:hypothetical protein